jgi:hypothetical protein
MSGFFLPVVDGLDLDAPVRSLLMPGVLVRDSHARLRRLPRFFYAVESWSVALETRLTPHFAFWEFMDVDLYEPAPLRRFPRYVPCAGTIISMSARRSSDMWLLQRACCRRCEQGRTDQGRAALTIMCILISDT